MDEFLQEDKPKAGGILFHGYRRVFVLVFAVAVLWQTVSFIQMQLASYHRAMVQEVKIIMPVTDNLDNAALTALGESLNSKEEVRSVKLFSPHDGLAVLQTKNPRLAQALVTLGREPMPAYFELYLYDRAINNIRSFVQNLAAQYPQLSIKYSQEQADMAFYSGICLRLVNAAAILTLMLFICFMLMVEAYPVHGPSHNLGAVGSALLAGVLSGAVLAIAVYPTGLLVQALSQFTSVARQAGLLVFCGLFGWTLGKWQKF